MSSAPEYYVLGSRAVPAYTALQAELNEKDWGKKKKKYICERGVFLASFGEYVVFLGLELSRVRFVFFL